MSSSRAITVAIHAPFGNNIERQLHNYLVTFALAAKASNVDVEVDVRTTHREETSELNNYKW